jgi:hypothetical protein
MNLWSQSSNLVKTVEENKMKLETVKVLSQNPVLRGKQFDVYYYETHGNIELLSVEITSGVKNLLTSLDEKSINDITKSLQDLLLTRRIKNINESFTESEKNIGFAQDADANTLKGLSND